MKTWTDTLRGFGHGVERVITKAIESRDSDELCPDVPEDQRFGAVHDRHNDFLDRAERGYAAKDVMTTQSIAEVADPREVKLGEAPSEAAKQSDKVPSVPDVLNGERAQSPFAHAVQRSNAMIREVKRSSDERKRSAERRRSAESHESNNSSGVGSSERRDQANVMPASSLPYDKQNVAASAAQASVALGVGQRMGSLQSQGSDSVRDSLDAQRRGTSIEIGPVLPRNLRSAIRLGDAPRTESQTLGTFDEISAGNANRVIRRRVVLPYQITLLFGAASVVSVGVSVGILVISIRNATWLHGPRAGPQLPEIKELLTQTLNATLAIKERLGA